MHSYFKCISLLLVCILASCSRSTIITPSDINIQTDSNSITPSSNINISVPSLYKPVVPGLLINMIYDHTDNISELASVELRRILYRTHAYKVYSSHESSQHDYTVKVKCTEFVPDTASLEGERKLPTTQAASIITIVGANMAATAPFLGPLGGLIAGFGPLTGIGLGSEVKEINSMLTLDIQLVDRHGTIVYSKPYSAGFNLKVATRGSIVSSNSKAVASSSAHEAVLAALETAVNDIRANAK